jgi:aryl-alcohol dehydrogenase-like predicted oxidoreductase
VTYGEETVISTKVRAARFSGGISSRDQVEQNLRDLGLDPLDLMYFRAGKDTSITREYAELSARRVSRLIRYLGLSGISKEQLDEVGSIRNVLAIPGTGSIELLEENVAAGRLRSTDEDIAMLGTVTPNPEE